MELGTTLHLVERGDWRAWLAEHHETEDEIWLVYYKKHSGKPRLPYNDAVEEALCFGWIDSIYKKIDEERIAQRFSRRKPKSKLSAMNQERIRRLIEQERMTAAGLAAVKHVYDPNPTLEIAPDVLGALHEDETTWANFEAFPDSYKRIRIGFLEGARTRPEMFETRLRYFLKMTSQNKRFGMVQ